MNPQDGIQALRELIGGDPQLDGKPHRYHADGDLPSQNTGHYLVLSDGQGFGSSWHPHSTVICHAPKPSGGSGYQ